MKRTGLLALVLLLPLAGCEQKEPPKAPPAQAKTAPAAPVLSDATRDRLQALRALGNGWLTSLTDCTAQLQDSIRTLLGQPDADHLDAARKQLQHCLILDQASRLLVGMSPAQEKALAKIRSNLDLPLDMPGYVDSIQGYPHSGIVNDFSLALTADNLRQQQGLIDQQDVAIGFDVVAFLLWGEHHFNPKLPPRNANQLQAVEHWEDGTTDMPVTEHPQNRRRQYLQLATSMLEQDCNKLRTSWDKGAPPPTETEARQWQTTQLQRAQTLLKQFPDNPMLATDLDQWLKVLESPAVAATSQPDTAPTEAGPAPDTAELTKRVQAALAALATGKTKPGTAAP